MPHFHGPVRRNLEKRAHSGLYELVIPADKQKGAFMNRLATVNSILLPYILILAVAVLRLTVSHPYNFVPVFACLLLFGACRPSREFATPLLALIGIDIFLTTHRYGYALTGGHAVTWIWYLGAMFLGAAMLGNSISPRRVLGSSLIASISFFVVSNFTVWAEWGMYPKTIGGLGACYIAALPFFRNSVVSEIVFSALIFSLAYVSENYMPAPRMRSTCS